MENALRNVKHQRLVIKTLYKVVFPEVEKAFTYSSSDADSDIDSGTW